MHQNAGILVMIPYEIEIGFAIGRLIVTFYEMCQRITQDSRHIHFSFVRVGESRSNALPPTFGNLVEFNPRSPNAVEVERLCEYIRQHRIETIFALDLSVNPKYLASVRTAGVRKIISYWGAPMSSRNRGLKLWLKRIEVAVLRRARPDHFIFESRAMRDFGVYGRGLPLRDTSVVHTGVDINKFRAVASASNIVHERFKIPAERKIVVYMGHLHRRKGVHVLMDAMGILVQQGHTNIHCLFLGNRNGEEEGFREHFTAAQSFITFGGYQSDIPELLSGCYVGCIPSTGWDSFPMSSLEMQACGLPVIASDWQGVPETLVDGRTGVVVPVSNASALAKAIAEMVDAPDTRQQMSDAARLRIEAEFAREHQVKNLVEQVSKILKE
jgi:glycosyltransferase involved in cell wall biosynthesis